MGLLIMPIEFKEKSEWSGWSKWRNGHIGFSGRHKRPWGLKISGFAFFRWDDSIHGLQVLIGVEGSTRIH